MEKHSRSMFKKRSQKMMEEYNSLSHKGRERYSDVKRMRSIRRRNDNSIIDKSNFYKKEYYNLEDATSSNMEIF